jgi:hypothetical protein
MKLLHLAHDAPPPTDARLAVAMLSGGLAALAVSVVMRLLPYGDVPPYVAASVLWRRRPERVSWSAANAVHLTAGTLAGLLFEGLLIGYERLREPLNIGIEVAIAGVTTLSELVVLSVVVAFLYAFFSWVVFPRYGGAAYETYPTTVRREWAISAVAYGVFLFFALAIVYSVLPV